ncbi:MAG: 50S ribosomal protein L2 [Candidatus Stahlbacteria bacterium]|nr:MAG: 50S ribosomal protein L2 [Candidatus Stahlbacteria bacterium]
MKEKGSRPVTPSRRYYRPPNFSSITRRKSEKSLTKYLPGTGGRNSEGRITSAHRGGRVRRKYRTIDFKRNKHLIEAKINSIEYDPNRSAWIALVFYKDGEKRYILAPHGLKVGDLIESGPNAPLITGNALPLSNIPLGTMIHNIELEPGRGGVLVRSAGAAAQLLAKEGKYAHIRMPSGEVRLILSSAYATLGRVSNIAHDVIMDGKAGRSRLKGRRPRVRGVAKNPVDHPMGGGEGRSSGGRHPTSKTGVLAKGYKTRNPKKQSSKYIIKRRKIRRRG